MLNLYVVNRAGSFSRHAVDMPSLCEYYDLYGWEVKNIACSSRIKPLMSFLILKSMFFGKNVEDKRNIIVKRARERAKLKKG